MTSDHKDIESLRDVLAKLIQLSKVKLTVDDIFHEFRLNEGKESRERLLKVLELISKNQPNADKHILEASLSLEKKCPTECLLQFLRNFTYLIMQTATNSKGIATSTPLLSSTKIFEFSKPENVLNIKERVQAAVNSCELSRTPGQCNYGMALAGKNISNTVETFSNTLVKNIPKWDLEGLDMVSYQTKNIGAIPISRQENLLIFDLIYCLSGVRGSYINVEEQPNEFGQIRFKVCDQIHSSLRDIVENILPLASYYICIQSFCQSISNSNSGAVLEALGAGMQALCRDYLLLLAQLESEHLANRITLHRILFYIRPTMVAMEVLASLVTDIIKEGLRGGKVLTLLYDKINELAGDEECQKFLIQLTQESACPYMDILKLWIQKGVINDPGQEFLVEDNEVIRREELPEHYSADYWEKRYTIRRDRIPKFLEKEADIILRTGKYLNVVRQCGKKVTQPQAMLIQFSTTNQNYIGSIQNAYKFASENLLQVLLEENDLMGHLMSVKRYLLLYQGDFITQFMDACEEELAKNIDQVLPMKLENLLGLTLRLSSAKTDPYNDEVHCELLTYDLVTQMSKILNDEKNLLPEPIDLVGLECFAFRYEVKWPVSLVLNHIAISKYQMLFRQLFYCKHVERQLCKVWNENSTAKKFNSETAEMYRSAFTLRQRMMNAVQNIEYYMTVEVIEPNWHTSIQSMKKAENVDEVLNIHQDFLDMCLKNCMLTDPILLRACIQLCKVCLLFCEFIQKSQKHFLDAELKSMVCDSSDSDSDIDPCSHKQSESSLAPTETFSERVKHFDMEFTEQLIQLLKNINNVTSDSPSDCFVNLVHRMNFNYFYNDQMEKLSATELIDI